MNDMINPRVSIIFFLIVAFITGCSDEAGDAPRVEDDHLVSATLKQDYPLEILKVVIAAFGQADLADKLKYSVQSYKVVYKTTYKGNTIEASGLILLPKSITDKAPLLSVQHGTTFVKSEAPSLSTTYTGSELFAAAGFITLVPDFIGYGASADVFHPYYDKEHSALAVIDLIKAAKEFLVKQKVPFSEKLFLTGYSEGGYVTLAAAEQMDTNSEDGLNVTAVAAGAGGYDLVNMLGDITSSETYSNPSYLAFVLMSYNNTYNWNKPLTYFFKQQYADALSQYMNGEYGSSFINDKLTTNVADLLDSDFYERLKQNSETDLKIALNDNSIHGWKTSFPIQLYHGTSDEVIPYQNSEITLGNFESAGSTSVTLTPIEGGTHGSSFVPMMEHFIPWFLELM
jgi:pimeloyl-ACP methyl ester carboxylesterase